MSHRCNSFPYSDWLLCVSSRLLFILPRWSLLMLSRRIRAQVGRTRAVRHMARALGRASIAELVASVDVETGWLQSDMDDWLLCGLLDVSSKWAASLPNITFALRSELQPSKPMSKVCSCIGPFLAWLLRRWSLLGWGLWFSRFLKWLLDWCCQMLLAPEQLFVTSLFG